MKLGRPVSFSATAAPGLAVLLFHVNPAALKTAGSLVVLLAAAVTTAAGLMVAVRLMCYLGGPMSSIDALPATFRRAFDVGRVRSRSTA